MFFGALLIAVPVSVFYRFTREKLSLYWREALTKRVLDKYYSDRTFYVMETLKEIDNPDQRITEDIKHFTRTSLDFLITLLTALIDLASFSAILYQIFPGLFLAIIAYAGIGSVITTKLGQALVGLNYERLQKEADFRFALVKTLILKPHLTMKKLLFFIFLLFKVRNRENAEAIAFYDKDAKIEKAHILALFQEALTVQLGLIVTQRNLEAFTTAYRYLVQILPSLLVAPLYFAHKIELGAISQAYIAFNHILGDFSLIINQFEAISAFSAGLTRLNSFLTTVTVGGWNQTLSMASSTALLMPPLSFIQTKRSSSMADDALVTCSNLTVLTPDKSEVIVGAIPATTSIGTPPSSSPLRGIDFMLYKGDKLLVVGNSGAGKSTFMRALAGLWQVGSGTVVWKSSLEDGEDGGSRETDESSSPPVDVFFLSQKPYNTQGTLAEQITYPSTRASSPSDAATLLGMLQKVKLPDLAERVGAGDAARGLNVTTDWSKVSVSIHSISSIGLLLTVSFFQVLSLGEQQRLAFARVLYNRPSVVIMDESTSALDLFAEEAMYQVLDDLGVTYISVGHRPSLLRYHRKKLVLRGPGKDVEASYILNSKDEESLIDITASS